MAVVKMRRVNICAARKDEKHLLADLQRMGAVEIERYSGEDDFISRMDTSAKISALEEKINLAERAIEILDEYAPEKKGIMSALNGRRRISRSEFGKTADKSEEILKNCAEIKTLKDNLTAVKQHAQAVNAEKAALVPWLNCPCSMGLKETKSTDIIYGTLPSSVNEDTVKEEIADKAAVFDIISTDKNLKYIAVISYKTDTAAVKEALANLGFAAPALKIPCTPAEYDKELDKAVNKAFAEEERLIGEIRKKARMRDNIKAAADYYRIISDRYRAAGELVYTKHAFVITGYIPEKYAAKTAAVLTEKYGAAIETEECDDCPAMTENSTFAASFEPVLESYGLPKKHDIDPAFIMGVFYVFLFGLMLSDAAYGLIITAACAFVLKKFQGMENSMRKSLRMFMYCGISTLFWGLMFGGFFGDAVSAVSKTFFGKSVELPALWFVPINDPMRLLLYSMLFGLIHLFTGLGIKGYMCIRDKDIKGFVCDVLAWFLLIIGLLLILMQSSVYASLAGSAISIGHIGSAAAKAAAIAGGVIILFTAGRDSKNIGKRLAKGLYSLYGITSWLSDLLSYSRLLALGLATGVIAQVVNSMGTMAGDGILGAAVFAVVFVVGHIFNLSINLLGAYVHTNRLQYVEFFGKFYEGGERKFNPFVENTKYITTDKQ